MELKDTINLMTSKNYKERLLAEYLGTLKEEANILGIDLAVINDESN